LPSQLTHLIFGHEFNKQCDKLPKYLTNLTFGYKFNCKVDLLPISLTNLTFGYTFNKSIKLLPDQIEHLVLGFSFNRPLNKLPINLQSLTLGERFNSEINYWGLKITILNFACVTHIIKNIPETVKEVKFAYCYSKSLQYLPKSITHLYFGSNISSPCLNDNITHLTIYNGLNYKWAKIPSSLIDLTICDYGKNMFDLPEGLTHLTIYKNYKYLEILPESLIYLSLNNYNGDFNKLLKNLLYLQIDGFFPQSIYFPPKLNYTDSSELTLTAQYDFSLIPEKFTQLNIICNFNENIKPIEYIPLHIKKIYLNKKYFYLIKKIPFGCVVYDIETKLIIN
jgi:hypothetical protein